MLLPEQLTARKLAHEAEKCLGMPHADVSLDLDGLSRVSAALGDLLAEAPAPPPARLRVAARRSVDMAGARAALDWPGILD